MNERNGKTQRKVGITVNLTASERDALGKLVSIKGLGMATLARCLVLALINGEVALPEVMQKYRAKLKELPDVDKSSELNGPELRTHRICIRLSLEESRELAVWARETFHHPAELIRILLKLHIMGLICPNGIIR